MMQIGICDDEKEVRDSIEREIRQLYREAEVIHFENGEALLAWSGCLDILFLDIQMEPMNGMEAARRLREAGNKVTVIFVTAIEEYVFQAFDVGAFHYLVKPIGQEKLKEVLEKAVEGRREIFSRESGGEPAIVVKTRGVSRKIYLSEILYAEVYNRKVILHKKDSEIEYYGKLSELQTEVGEDFFRTHRAYLVNMNYIVRYDAATVYLERGQVPMAKRNYPEFVKRYLQFNRKAI